MARLDDGFSTIITLGTTGAVKLYEKTVTPPGIDGGGPNDTTTMRNTALRTKKPKKLKTMTTMSFTAAYDPAVYSEIFDEINVNQLITITFPDGSTLAVWGWLNAFTPNEITEGEQPTAEASFELSNENSADPPVEVAPVYTAPA